MSGLCHSVVAGTQKLSGYSDTIIDEVIVNCTPFVRQYGILFRKWGVFVCQKGCIFSEPAKLLNFLTTDGSKDTGF